MNDVRDAIERVGARFDPPDDGFEDLSRRLDRARKRRRIGAGALALAVATGGALLAFRSIPASAPGPNSRIRVLATWPATSNAIPKVVASSATGCPTPNGDSPPPVSLSATSGAAGSSVDVSGTFPNAELWLQLWWNAGEPPATVAPPPWPPTGPDIRFQPAGPGPVSELASVAGPATTGDCSFHTRFTVPDVEPGTYRIQWVFGFLSHALEPSDQDGYALLTSVLKFQVTG
jgi:hypothetical protein